MASKSRSATVGTGVIVENFLRSTTIVMDWIPSGRCWAGVKGELACDESPPEKKRGRPNVFEGDGRSPNQSNL